MSSNSQQPPPELSYKERLDQKAVEARDPDAGKRNSQPSVLEKAAEYVPEAAKETAAKILGTAAGGQGREGESGKEEGGEEAPGVAGEAVGQPARPAHDHVIEEFVRDQHKSKKGKEQAAGA